MSAECFPITDLPHLPRLFADYTELRFPGGGAPARRFYSGHAFDGGWQRGNAVRLQPARGELCDALGEQARGFDSSPETFANLQRLRDGAHAVVTGQQVGLFGGPLLTLMKAATAIRKSQVATEHGFPHVPIFWMATEDHDLDEVNQVSLLGRHTVETLRSTFPGHKQQPVGNLQLGPQIEAVLERAEELLAYAPVTETLRECYATGETLASAFGKFLSRIFAPFGLIVIDASTREFHRMGAPVLRDAIVNADTLHDAVTARDLEITAAGYHPQVLVNPDSTLLFLIDGSGNRLPLRRPAAANGERSWKAGSQTYTTEDLLAILDAEPERLSPNALLRPVFQDSILPTSAYVGGPAEISYLAQSAPVYQAMLGALTPVLPRLSATLTTPSIRMVMDRHEVTLRDVLITPDELAQRFAARAMPVEGKRKLAAAGNGLDAELQAVEQWMTSMDPSLGRSAGVAANKMRYQMNRLRRLASNFQMEREGHLRKHADALTLSLYPNGHMQERLLAGIQFLATATCDLPQLLVDNAEQECPGHRVFNI